LKLDSSTTANQSSDVRTHGRPQPGTPAPPASLLPSSGAPQGLRRDDVLISAVVVGAALAAFWPGLHNQFLNWDDDRNFLENPAFQGLGAAQLRWAWSTYHLGVWQPVSWLLLSVQYCLGGLESPFYHAVSLALHALNAVVLYFLTLALLRIALSGADQGFDKVIRVCAAAGAILFAVHPLRVEAVSWISCQPYLPASLFYMLSVLTYLHGQRGNVGSRAWSLWLAAAFALYLLAVMSKAVAVSLPVVLLILDVYPLRRWNARKGWLGASALRVWGEKLPFIAVAIVVSVWAAHAKDFNESRVPFAFAAMNARLAQSAYGLLFYLVKTLAPTHLIAYYDLPKNLGLQTWRYDLCTGVVLAGTIAMILWRRRCPPILAAWLAYVVILLPNLGLVQISRQLITDRYSYLAIMPPMILMAGAAARFCASRVGRKRLVRITLLGGGAAAVLALGAAARRQVLVWHDSCSLWQSTLAVSPDCAVAECNLGLALFAKGQYRDASGHISRAIDLDRDFTFAWANLGLLCNQAGQPERAVVCFERALGGEASLGRPDLAKVHAGLGAAYAALRRDDLAWKHTRLAQKLGFKDARKMLDYLRRFSKEPPSQE
jgi:tetratricopeptide (TPR) repeat protein